MEATEYGRWWWKSQVLSHGESSRSHQCLPQKTPCPQERQAHSGRERSTLVYYTCASKFGETSVCVIVYISEEVIVSYYCLGKFRRSIRGVGTSPLAASSHSLKLLSIWSRFYFRFCILSLRACTPSFSRLRQRRTPRRVAKVKESILVLPSTRWASCRI